MKHKFITVMMFIIWSGSAWADTYTIQKPHEIFVDRETMIERIRERGLDRTCYQEDHRYLDSVPIQIKSGVRGAPISEEIDKTTKPILTGYCRAIQADLLGNTEEYERETGAILRFIERLAETQYFTKWPKNGSDSDHSYATSKSVISTLFVYAHHRHLYTPDQQALIDGEFIRLVKRNAYARSEPVVGENSTWNNHGLHLVNLQLLTAITVGDNDLFRSSVQHFENLMKRNSTKTGLWKYDSRRGECALHYNLHSLPPFMSILWNLRHQGIEWFDEPLTGKHSPRQMIEAIVAATGNIETVVDQNRSVGYSSHKGQTSCRYLEEKIKVDGKWIRVPTESTTWVSVWKAMGGNIQITSSSQHVQKLNRYDKWSSNSAWISYFRNYIYQ